jgi:hypothetical protein
MYPPQFKIELIHMARLALESPICESRSNSLIDSDSILVQIGVLIQNGSSGVLYFSFVTFKKS